MSVSALVSPVIADPAEAVYFREYGTGDEIMVGLHGWSGDHRSFEPLLPWLPQQVRLLSFDQPGFGQSPPPPEWSIRAIAEPIAQVLERRGVEGLTVIGSCSGAVVGMELSMMLGPRVKRLVMIDPFMTAPWFFRLFCWGWFGRLCYLSTFANPIGRWVTNRSLADRRTEETSLTEHFREADHDRALGYLRVMCDPGLHRRGYERLDAIGEFVVGGRSFASARRSVDWWRETCWPSASVVTIERAGHMPVHEAADEVADIVFGPCVRTDPRDMGADRRNTRADSRTGT